MTANTSPQGSRRCRRRRARTGALVALAVLAASVVAVTSEAPVSGAATSSATAAGLAALNKASTSSRGVTATSITIVFPISNLTTLASNFGFAGDAEFAQQTNAIHTYVNAINNHGGINGRKIKPIIVTFDPTNEAQMRADCLQWTKGSPAVFAVIDGLGSWTGDNQLCITQEGHTPFIGQWTTTTNWTTLGAPYLWWTGPDQASILSTLVVSSCSAATNSRSDVVRIKWRRDRRIHHQARSVARDGDVSSPVPASTK